jgi:oligosaccharide repeat unit polymerase
MTARVLPLRSAFSPLVLVAVLYVPLLILYAISSPNVFAADFGSRKALSLTGLAYFALALLLFAAGAKAGDDRAQARLRSAGRERPPEPAQLRSLTVLVETALVLSIGAYAVWFARGIVRAGGIAELLEAWRDDPNRVKAEILATVPGVTTLTQLAVAAIPLAVAFGLARRRSLIPGLVVLVLLLAGARTVLYNERLALIELLLPTVFLVAAPRKVTAPRIAVYAAVLVLGAITFFAMTELRRTYAYTGDFSAGRASTRFLGYYLTSVNNGMVVVDEYPARTPFSTSGEALWRFPGLRNLRADHFPVLGTVSLRYEDLFGIDPERFWPQAFATQGLDYEFNVFTTPGYLAADFGWAGLVGVFVLGLISGVLYRRSAASSLHRALYAVWLVGLFEFMRILYFTDTRVFPAYLVFLGAYLVLRRRVPAPLPAPAQPVDRAVG